MPTYGHRLPSRHNVSTRQPKRVRRKPGDTWPNESRVLTHYRRLDDLEKEIQHLRSSVPTLPAASARPLRRISADPIPDASLDAEPSFVQARPPEAKESLLLTGSPTVPLLERYSPQIIAQEQPSPLSNLTNDHRTSTSPRSLDFLDFGGTQIDNHFNVSV